MTGNCRSHVSDVAGGCLCGAVRYRIHGRPLSSNICYCETCCRAAAAPMVAWIDIEPAQFTIQAGAMACFKSSPPVERGFCSACGTTLSYRRRAGETDKLSVATLSLDDLDRFPPTERVLHRDRLPWIDGVADLPDEEERRGQSCCT